MGCASGLVKYLVFLFNLVFALAGLAMLAVGILYVIDIKDMSNALEQQSYIVAPTLLIIVGGIVFVISFFGCCGAIKESTCMLTTYGVFLLSLFILQIALGVYAFLQVKENNADFKNEVYRELEKAYRKYNTDTTSKEAIDAMQQVIQCCGNNGPSDFGNHIPSSCCKGNKEHCYIADPQLFHDPCKDKLYKTLKDSVQVLGYVAIGLCVTELVAAIFSFCLASSIRNERRRHNYA